MKTIVVGFSHTDKLLSRLIMWATRSNISHTYVKIVFPALEATLIFQASGLSVNVVNEDIFNSHAKVVKEITLKLADEDFKEGKKFLVSQLGKPYSIKQLIGHAWVLLNRTVGIKKKNPYADGDHAYVCVELVARYLGMKNAEEMTPEDLYKILSAKTPC